MPRGPTQDDGGAAVRVELSVANLTKVGLIVLLLFGLTAALAIWAAQTYYLDASGGQS